MSVLVPAFNDGRYLDDCLGSIAAQSWRDFEVIIADDASTDESPEIAARWAAQDSRFRVAISPRNLGMNPNWNRALGLATGEFVLKLDADDAIAPTCLETLIAEFDRTNDLLLAACRTLDCDETLQPVQAFLGDEGLRLHGLDPEKRHVLAGLEWLRMCFDGIQLWTSNALLFRRSDLMALGGWDERWVAADTDLILRALALDRPVAHVPLPGILYRRRPDSMSDRQRRSGEASLETSRIMLGALRSHAARLRPWTGALRQNWWRYWHNFNAHPVAPSEQHRAERIALSPPIGVRLWGSIRYAFWRLRRFTRLQEHDPVTPP